ncbi:MAPEG family protein [Oceanobacter mangrovi]|uniref:MAPEG family protein n=1 Tax=Oceanobacter mangrovi TaxID=2862510 RepID=UPI001C8D43ED|nr:MAPEG family protein [Oceanobacter mangrovi]
MTALFAALLAPLLVLLSLQTIRLRRRFLVGIGDGGHAELARAIRAQGNFIEYVPMALLLLYGLESLSAAHWLIELSGGLLLVGRYLHAWGISQLNEKLRFRVTGIMCTFGSIMLSALAIIWIRIF